MRLPESWFVEYLGKPWEPVPEPPRSFNCGELVREIYRRYLGIDTPAIPVTDARRGLQCLRAMNQPDFFGFEPLVSEPRELDVAFLGRGNHLAHCGVLVRTREGSRILHCPQVASGVVLDSLLELAVSGFPAVRWFRHRDMDKALRERGLDLL